MSEICDRCYKDITNPDEHGWMRCPLEPRQTQHSIIGDGIPGGIVIRHLQKEPMTFYSKTDLKRAANERGWTIHGDSPKPYRVAWSGRRKDGSTP